MRDCQISKLSSKYSAHTRFHIFLYQQNDCLSLKTLTRPPLTCDWYTMPYTCIYIMYSIKLTRHEYDFLWLIVSHQRLNFFYGSRFYVLHIDDLCTLKYTKYYSSCGATFVYLYECVHINVYICTFMETNTKRTRFFKYDILCSHLKS